MMHRFDSRTARFVEALREEIAGDPNFAVPASSIEQLDVGTAATRYLWKALESDSIPDLTPGKADGVTGDFKSIGTETIVLTRTTIVKFRQTYNKIPVYSSLVAVELDEDNGLMSLSSSLGDPNDVDPIANISPAEALKRIRGHPGYKKELEGAIPQLHYYFDAYSGRKAHWRLVYITEDVPVHRFRRKRSDSVSQLMDYFVDAHRGKVVAELPRTQTMASTEEMAQDENGVRRSLRVRVDSNRNILRDDRFPLQTFNFRFQDVDSQRIFLPGRTITNPPPWPSAAVSAQANGVNVAQFLRRVLRRNNIDNRGGAIYHSVNCFADDGNNSSDPDKPLDWSNARWMGTQAVYGQKTFGDRLVSLAVHLDVVAHELFHGVTAATARLEYRGQSGALNESFSDIFGVIVSNFDRNDVGQWNWQLGAGFAQNDLPFRDFHKPGNLNQPENMNRYRSLPTDEDHDYGGVHLYSGIHNHAVFFILTAVDTAGNYVLTPEEVARVFYIALTQHLSRRSRFRDSRRAAIVAARTLFRDRSQPVQDAKVDAIEAGFDRVGIRA